jgi:hypothetical protein
MMDYAKAIRAADFTVLFIWQNKDMSFDRVDANTGWKMRKIFSGWMGSRLGESCGALN